MIRRPPRSTLFPTRRSSDLVLDDARDRDHGAARRRVAVSLGPAREKQDRKSTRLNSSHGYISYAVFCLKKKKALCSNQTSVTRQKIRIVFDTHQNGRRLNGL